MPFPILNTILPHTLVSYPLPLTAMCYNVIDGRYYSVCQHFESMSTQTHDCLEQNCVFSRRHVHNTSSCRASCKRLMALPVRNPIRISDTECLNCKAKAHDPGSKCQSPA